MIRFGSRPVVLVAGLVAAGLFILQLQGVFADARLR